MSADDIWTAIAVASAVGSGCFMLIARRNARKATREAEGQVRRSPRQLPDGRGSK